MVGVFQKFKLSNMGAIMSLVVSVATVIGLCVSLLNFVILNQLSPVATGLEKLDLRVQAVEITNTDDISTTDFRNEMTILRGEMATRDGDIIHRLDLISGRLDKIIIK